MQWPQLGFEPGMPIPFFVMITDIHTYTFKQYKHRNQYTCIYVSDFIHVQTFVRLNQKSKISGAPHEELNHWEWFAKLAHAPFCSSSSRHMVLQTQIHITKIYSMRKINT